MNIYLLIMSSSLSNIDIMIILMKKFIKSNAKMIAIIKNAKRVELSSKIASAVLNTQA